MIGAWILIFNALNIFQELMTIWAEYVKTTAASFRQDFLGDGLAKNKRLSKHPPANKILSMSTIDKHQDLLQHWDIKQNIAALT